MAPSETKADLDCYFGIDLEDDSDGDNEGDNDTFEVQVGIRNFCSTVLRKYLADHEIPILRNLPD